MILEVIKELESQRQEMNISRESIEFITVICRALKPKNILEIGAFNGYSALWLSLNAEKVVTLEIDEENVKLAQENFKKANCKNIEIVHGDAFKTLQMQFYKFDVVLIDGRKSEYQTYLEFVLNTITENALIFVDNTISHKDKLDNFFDYLKRSKLYYKELNLGKGLMLISKNQF